MLQHAPGALLVATCLAACAAEIPVGKPELSDADVQSQARSLSAGLATRAQAHELLGPPWLASERFGVEVYRSTDTQHKMLLVFAPYPVPVPMPGDRIEAYTLISYDSDGRVTGVDAAFGQDSVSSAGPISVVIRADDIEFSRGREATLTIPLARYLERRSAESRSACTVLVGCENEGICWDRLQVDAGRAREMPILRVTLPTERERAPAVEGAVPDPAATVESCAAEGGVLAHGRCLPFESLLHRRLVPVELSAGRHQLRFTARLRSGEAHGELDCVPGALVYAILGGRLLETYTLAQQLKHGLATSAAAGTVTFSSEVPDGPAADNVVIYYDGHWLVASTP